MSIEDLIARNRRWAADEVSRDPDFFSRLAEQQSPGYLWIGCSDSRVPANTIIGLPPGDVFVHRNVANLVVHSDLNCLSVLQYAVDVLKVEEVIVCGHYGCGGVRAALLDSQNGLIDNWLLHLRDLRRVHDDELKQLPSERERLDRLCELNVQAQAVNVGETTIVRDAWARGQQLTIHGLIYAVQDGLLNDLGGSMSSPEEHYAQWEKITASV